MFCYLSLCYNLLINQQISNKSINTKRAIQIIYYFLFITFTIRLKIKNIDYKLRYLLNCKDDI